jgi:oligopeptide/dipeptide ABC transporter ATP-binding protein
VAIARALAVEPKVLIADEPTSMLDASVRVGVLSMLQQLVREQQLALVLITHDLATARQLCDRVVVLFAGRVVETGPSQTLFGSPLHPYTLSLMAALPKGVPRGAALPVLRGLGPLKPGACPFLPRCPEAVARCQGQVPELTERANGAMVRCFVRGHSNVV